MSTIVVCMVVKAQEHRPGGSEFEYMHSTVLCSLGLLCCNNEAEWISV